MWCYLLAEEKNEGVPLVKLITQCEKHLTKPDLRYVKMNQKHEIKGKTTTGWKAEIVYFSIKSQVVRWKSQLWWNMLQNRYCNKAFIVDINPIRGVNDVFTHVRKILLGQSKPTELRAFRAKIPAFFRCLQPACSVVAPVASRVKD